VGGKLTLTSEGANAYLTGGDELEGCLLQIWHFKKFNEGRWATIGKASMAMVAGFCTGLESLVDKIIELGYPKRYIDGFRSRLEERKSLRRFFTVTALSASVADSLMFELFRDPRVARRLKELEAKGWEEACKVGERADLVWKVTAAAAQIDDWTDLRSDTLGSCFSALGYIEWKTYRAARRPPWDLCSGNILESVRNLCARADRPKHLSHEKIWCLGRGGVPVEHLAEAVKLQAYVGPSRIAYGP
jgi:hypothetical protein